MKIKVGREPERDPERLAAAREAIGPDVALMVDANGAFDAAQAARWAERYAEFGVSYFEEPVSSDDLEGLRWLRDAVPAGIEIAAGEYAWDLPELSALAALRRRAPGRRHPLRRASPTSCAPTASAAPATCRSRPTAPRRSRHTLCCAMERPVHVEYFHDHERVESILFEGALDIEDGELRPDPARPGLGVELNRSEAERFRAS